MDRSGAKTLPVMLGKCVFWSGTEFLLDITIPEMRIYRFPVSKHLLNIDLRSKVDQRPIQL